MKYNPSGGGGGEGGSWNPGTYPDFPKHRSYNRLKFENTIIKRHHNIIVSC